MTYHRKNKHTPRINPEVEDFLTTVGPQLMKSFLQRYINGQRSLRGHHYDTQPDHSFRSAYQERMVEL